MKKLLTFSVVAVMAVGVYSTVNSVRDQRRDLMSQNIEALSAGEGPGGCNYAVVAYDEGTNKLYCFDAGKRCCTYNPNFN